MKTEIPTPKMLTPKAPKFPRTWTKATPRDNLLNSSSTYYLKATNYRVTRALGLSDWALYNKDEWLGEYTTLKLAKLAASVEFVLDNTVKTGNQFDRSCCLKLEGMTLTTNPDGGGNWPWAFEPAGEETELHYLTSEEFSTEANRWGFPPVVTFAYLMSDGELDEFLYILQRECPALSLPSPRSIRTRKSFWSR